MRYKKLFGKTLRSVPQDVRARSSELLLRGGFVRSLGHGLFSFLPLGFRVVRNICGIIREEMEALGGQEVLAPIVNPYELWKRSRRTDLIDRDLVRFRDRDGRDLVLAPTHEEAMVELVRVAMNSYRELPVFLFQFQNKFRDEERTRAGLMRTKEFMMKDAYSFHRSYTDLNNFFPRVFAAYRRVFERCHIGIITAESGVGYMAGEKAYEFLMPSHLGDSVIISCPACGYRANRDVARGNKRTGSNDSATLPPVERVATPGCKTIEDVAGALKVNRGGIAKSLVYRLASGFVMAVVRGDYEISTEKLSRLTKQPVIGLAEEEDLSSMGLITGYLSPVGLSGRLPVIVDDVAAATPNLTFGANEEGVHLLNVNIERDYNCEIVGDIAQIRAEDTCVQCGAALEEIRAVELGNIFKLGDYYSRAMNLTFQEDSGEKVYPNMGSYGIGIGRLMASIVEANNDEEGIIWPGELAPYRGYLMGIGKAPSVAKIVEELHSSNPDHILLDDRDESPGVKFRDADLLGIPLRIVVSSKHLPKIEIRERRSGHVRLIPPADLSRTLEQFEAEDLTHAI